MSRPDRAIKRLRGWCNINPAHSIREDLGALLDHMKELEELMEAAEKAERDRHDNWLAAAGDCGP